MFTGTKQGGQTGNYLKTGLTAFKFLGVNPTVSQIEDWTGRDNVQEPNYDLAEDFNQKTVRPVHIWLKNDDVTVHFRLNIGTDDAIAKSGNYQVCTSTGSIIWAKTAGQVKPEFVDHKALKVGEADWIDFVSRLINFDQKSGENLYSQMTQLGLDVQSLYDGKNKGANELAAWAGEKDKKISMVLVVTEKDGTDANGNPTTKRYQNIATDSNTWFHGEVTDWAEAKLLERYQKSLDVGTGQTQAYPIIKALFTIKYQDFKKEDCYNTVPDNPTTTSSWN